MPQPKSLEGFGEVRAWLDAALERGSLEVTCPSTAKAHSLRHACYACRMRDRQQTRRVYEKDDPQFDRSAYEVLSFLITDNVLLITTKRLTAAGYVARDPQTGEEVEVG